MQTKGCRNPPHELLSHLKSPTGLVRGPQILIALLVQGNKPAWYPHTKEQVDVLLRDMI